MEVGSCREDGPTYFRRSVVVYILVNLPLVLLTYDAFNLNGNILSTSYLALGLNPYAYGSSVGVGYVILPGVGYQFLSYNALSWIVFQPSGYSLLAASVALKTIGVAAGIGVAWLGRELVRDAGLPHERAVFLALLFNPYLIFVTAVWGGTEALVVFLLLLAIWAFRRGWSDPVHYPAVVLGAVALALVTFSYYFAALLLPTLIFYLPDRARQLRAVGILAIVLGVFGIPLLAFHLISYGSTNLGTSNPLNAYSVVNLLGPRTAATVARGQLAFTAGAAALAVLLPAWFLRRRLDLFTSLLTVTVVAFALTFFLPGDAFAILAPLAVLALAFVDPARFSVWRALAVQAFLLPIFVIVQMVNGPGQVTGVFYWSYFVLQRNIILYPLLGGRLGLEILLGLYAAGAVATVAILSFVAAHRRRTPDRRPIVPRPPRPFAPYEVRQRQALRVAAVALVLVTASIVGAYAFPEGSTIASGGQFNTQEFYAYDAANPGLYPLQSNATYSVNPTAGELSYTPDSAPVGFARNIEHQMTTLAFNATLRAPNNRGPVPLLETSQVTVLYSTALHTDSVGAWTPVSTGGASDILGQTTVTVGSVRVYVTNGSQAIEYDEPMSAVTGSVEYFAAEFSQEASSRTVLWAVYAGPVTVTGFIQGQTFYLGTNASGEWKYNGTLTSVSPQEWLLGGFQIAQNLSSVTAWVNNARISIPAAIPTVGDVTVFTGKSNESSAANRSDALIGVISPIYSGAPGAAQFQSGFYAAVGSAFSAEAIATGSTIDVTYLNSPNGAEIIVNGSEVRSSTPDRLMIVGKLGFCSGNINLTFSQVTFSRASSGPNLAWVIAGFGILLPGWLVGWALFRLGAIRLLRGRIGERTPSPPPRSDGAAPVPTDEARHEPGGIDDVRDEPQ